MPVSTRHKPATAALFLLAACAVSLALEAAGIKVREVTTWQVHNRVLLSAELALELSPEALRALNHGVTLDIVIDIQALEERAWLWDPTVIEHSERFHLERQALNKQYLVTHNYNQRSFISLQEALQYISTVRNYPLLNVTDLEEGKSYYGRMRAWLDIESLPAPMRPTAYVSTSWRLASDWHKWQIET